MLPALSLLSVGGVVRRKSLTMLALRRTTLPKVAALARCLGSGGSEPGDTASSSSSSSWRRGQLEQLERKLTYPLPPTIDDEDSLQPEWKAMESRVTKRRSLTADQKGGKSGRSNIRRGEEDVWLENGLYDDKDKRKDP